MEKPRILTKGADGKHGFHDHRSEVRIMLKVIYMCPMDDEIKTILRMRIWGVNPTYFRPLTCEQIAMVTKMKVEEVEKVEAVGKENCQKFLLNQSTQEAVDRFNADSEGMKNHMFAKQPYQKKKFSV